MPLIVVPSTGVQLPPPIRNHQSSGPSDSVRSTDTLPLTVADRLALGAGWGMVNDVVLPTWCEHPLSRYALTL